MPDYQGNSHKSKTEPQPEAKVVEKVVTGKVVQQKKGVGRKFKELVLAADFKSVAEYVGLNVMLPALRNMAVDSAYRGAERLFLGESASRRSAMGPGVRVQYNEQVRRPSIMDPRRQQTMLPQRPSMQRTGVGSYDYVLSSSEDADRVLGNMQNIVETYGYVTVSDLNQMVGYPVSTVDESFGWTIIGHAKVVQLRDGWLLDLPPVIAL